jgi:hypothetical protein
MSTRSGTVRRWNGNDDGGGDVAIVRKAQREMIDAATLGEGGGRSVQAEVAAALPIAADLDGAVVGPRVRRLEGFDDRFLRGEARGKTLCGHLRCAGSAVRRLVCAKRAAYVGIAEPIEGGGDVADADDIDTHLQRWKHWTDY